MFANISSFFSNIFSLFRGPRFISKNLSDFLDLSVSSCVLGISKRSITSNIIANIPHASLLLLKKEINDFYDDDELENESGIIIEYGEFSPDMTETRKNNSKNNEVIYPYGDKGGLRYYVKKYGEFIKQFGDIGYIDLNIEQNNEQTIEYFINKITKSEDNIWIKDNYSIGLTNFNSHTFVIEALKILKPHFHPFNAHPTDLALAQRKNKARLDFIPSNIKTELMKYYKKY